MNVASGGAGQADPDPRSLARSAVDDDFPTVIRHDAVGERKSKPRTALVDAGGVEGVEDVGKLFWFHAAPVVCDNGARYATS